MNISLIGKKADSNQNIVAYRFVDLTSRHIIDVNKSDLASYCDGKEFTNASYDGTDMSLYFQHVSYLPNFYDDGSVSSYYYKVILDVLSDQLRVGNITGGDVYVKIDPEVLKYYNLREKFDLIVNTSSKVAKFSQLMDGSYVTEEISSRNINTIRTYNGRHTYLYDLNKFMECYYKNKSCYYVNSTTMDCVLTCSKSLGKYTLISMRENEKSDRYHIHSHSTHFYENETHNFPYDGTMNVVSLSDGGETYVLFGIDGITFLGNKFEELHNEDVSDYYNGLLAMSPDDAALFKNNFKLGSQRDVLDCNLAYISLPDGVEKIHQDSLRYDFYRDRNAYIDYIHGKNNVFVIPKSVTSFDNVAFHNNGFTNFNPEGITATTTIKVENPDIAINVINAAISSGNTWRGMEVAGSIPLSYSLVRRLSECSDTFKFTSDNFRIIITPCLNTHGYAIRPYSVDVDCKGRTTQVLIFESYEDFNRIFVEREKKLCSLYDAIKKEVPLRLVASCTLDDYKKFNRRVYHLLSEYSALYNMTSHSMIKDGDALAYRRLVRSIESRYKNLLTLKKEKLKLFELTMNSSWKRPISFEVK